MQCSYSMHYSVNCKRYTSTFLNVFANVSPCKSYLKSNIVIWLILSHVLIYWFADWSWNIMSTNAWLLLVSLFPLSNDNMTKYVVDIIIIHILFVRTYITVNFTRTVMPTTEPFYDFYKAIIFFSGSTICLNNFKLNLTYFIIEVLYLRDNTYDVVPYLSIEYGKSWKHRNSLFNYISLLGLVSLHINMLLLY